MCIHSVATRRIVKYCFGPLVKTNGHCLAPIPHTYYSTRSPFCDPMTQLSMMNDDRGVTEEARLKSDEQTTGGATSISHTHSHKQVMTDGSAHYFASCVLC